MALDSCLSAIRAVSGDKLSDADILDLLTEIERRARRRHKRSGKSFDDDVLDVADDMAKTTVAAARIERRNKLLRLRKQAAFREFLNDVVKEGYSPAMAFEARNVGVNAPIPFGGLSGDAEAKAIFSTFATGFLRDLDEEGVLSLFNSRQLTQEIADERWELSLKDGKPGITGNEEALKIAKILEKWQMRSVARQNRAGAWIGKVQGFITSRTTDQAKIRRAKFSGWRDAVLRHADIDRSFPEGDIDAALQSTYDVLKTGVRLEGAETDADLSLVFKGPENLAKRLSRHRTLHFKSAADELAYLAQFGRYDFNEAVFAEMRHAAHNIALMETWGPNPRALFENSLADAVQRFRGADDTAAVDALQSKSLRDQFDAIDGTDATHDSLTSAKIGAGARAIQNMSKLGFATISAISDLGFTFSELNFQGRTLLSSFYDTMQVIPGGIRSEFGELTGAGIDGMIGDMAHRFSAQDGLSGWLSRLQRNYFKANILTWWTDAHKRGLARVMAKDLALRAKGPYEALPEARRRLLAQYGITEREWSLVQRAVAVEADGREYVLPQNVQDLDDDVVGAALGVSKRNVLREKDAIETALRAFYVDRADYGSPTPGARERAIMLRGTKSGTVEGEALRYMWQFKGFPLTAITKPVGRHVYGLGAKNLREAFLQGKGDRLGLAALIVSTTILGYVAQSAKEMAKGRAPLDPTSYKTWLAAVLQGGAAGLYGDFLLGETNRYGRSLAETLLGPTAGLIGDIDEIRARLMYGDDAAAHALRTALSNTPFANLFYVRPVLDFLIIYQAMEAMNPGYLRRMERNMEQKSERRFLIRPSEIVR